MLNIHIKCMCTHESKNIKTNHIAYFCVCFKLKLWCYVENDPCMKVENSCSKLNIVVSLCNVPFLFYFTTCHLTFFFQLSGQQRDWSAPCSPDISKLFSHRNSGGRISSASVTLRCVHETPNDVMFFTVNIIYFSIALYSNISILQTTNVYNIYELMKIHFMFLQNVNNPT